MPFPFYNLACSNFTLSSTTTRFNVVTNSTCKCSQRIKGVASSPCRELIHPSFNSTGH